MFPLCAPKKGSPTGRINQVYEYCDPTSHVTSMIPLLAVKLTSGVKEVGAGGLVAAAELGSATVTRPTAVAVAAPRHRMRRRKRAFPMPPEVRDASIKPERPSGVCLDLDATLSAGRESLRLARLSLVA